MELTNNDRFDLAALLLLDKLDTRHSAQVRPSLTLGEYYDVLSDFLRLAPDISRGLTKLERIEAEREDRRYLNQLISLMETIGCEAFVVESHSILNAYENSGNWRLAGTHARQMRDDFNNFSGQIEKAAKKLSSDSQAAGGSETEAAETAGSEAEAAGAENADAGVAAALPLKDAIRLFDEKAASGKKVILAVDDSPAILQSLWAVLNDTYQVLVLAKPEEIDKVLRNQKQKPDLFLLDYKMPGLSGFDLIPIIRGYAEHSDTPIIFLTSDGSLDNVTSALALGALDFIVKPFKPEILREKISKHI